MCNLYLRMVVLMDGFMFTFVKMIVTSALTQQINAQGHSVLQLG